MGASEVGGRVLAFASHQSRTTMEIRILRRGDEAVLARVAPDVFDDPIDARASEAFLARAREVGARLRAGLERISARHPQAGEVRGLGPMLAVEFVKDPATKEPFPELVLEVTRQALRRGLIVIRAGLYSNCIRLLPPLNLTDAEVDEGLEVLEEAVAAAVAAHAVGGVA